MPDSERHDLDEFCGLLSTMDETEQYHPTRQLTDVLQKEVNSGTKSDAVESVGVRSALSAMHSVFADNCQHDSAVAVDTLLNSFARPAECGDGVNVISSDVEWEKSVRYRCSGYMYEYGEQRVTAYHFDVQVRTRLEIENWISKNIVKYEEIERQCVGCPCQFSERMEEVSKVPPTALIQLDAPSRNWRGALSKRVMTFPRRPS